MAELVLPKNSKVKDGKNILLIQVLKIKNHSKYIVGILRKMIIQDMIYMRLISINVDLWFWMLLLKLKMK